MDKQYDLDLEELEEGLKAEKIVLLKTTLKYVKL